VEASEEAEGMTDEDGSKVEAWKRLARVWGLRGWDFVRAHWVLLALLIGFVLTVSFVGGAVTRSDFFERAVNLAPENAFAAPEPVEAGGAPWGTDTLGTDWMSRVLVGTSGTLFVAMTGWLVIFVAGGGVGILIMQMPRPVRALAGLKSALLIGIPGFLIVSALGVVFGGGPWGVMLAMGTVGTLFIGLMVADALFDVEKEPFFMAAVASGIPRSQLWPGILLVRAIWVALAGSLAAVPALLLVESAFSFMRGGGSDGMWTLGTLMGEVRPYVIDAPWLMFYPGMVLLALCFVTRVVADGVGFRLRRSTRILATEWRWF
jgi:peptide/nickel transport system permease protein